MKNSDDWTSKQLEQRQDPWIPVSHQSYWSAEAEAFVDLVGGHGAANECMNAAVITALGQLGFNALRGQWLSSDMSWIDMCMQALRHANKEVPNGRP